MTTSDDYIKFQVLDWNEYHDENASGEEEYRVRIFGRTDNDKTICCDVRDFTPYFYVKVKQNWSQSLLMMFVKELKKRVYPTEFVDGLKKYSFYEAYDYYGFTNYTKFKYIRFEFNSLNSFKAYERAFKKKFKISMIDKYPFKLKLYESNIIPFIRLMHIRQLGSVGWIKIKKDSYKEYKLGDEPTHCKINIFCNYNKLENHEEIKSVKFVIGSYDLECTSCDGSFPNPKRPTDKIIQIGLTLSKYGEDECYEKHILTLNGCSNLPNIIVKSYETEEELLLGFTKLIKETDPDILTGYNIFGFDFEYLYERAKLLDIEPKFSRFSRIKNLPCEYIETKLASSALGENILRYYKMPGRVVFDLMKVIQRDYKLASYGLNSAASTFIRENIISIEVKDEHTIINTKNTNGIYVGQYIMLCYNDGFTENIYKKKYSNDNQKFKVEELTKNTIKVKETVDTTEFMDKGYKVFWSQAKDDISPHEIFALQEKEDKDRALIAKYCVQDCALCNKLISRLQIITNNIGMAMVCHVPLSFLFLRGQGVKIFSLVAKKCREKNHLIPVLKKKFKPEETQETDKLQKETVRIEKYLNNKFQQYEDDEEEEDEMGYEGATVFEPKTGVHMEPIPVLDYGSLYPNAMRLRNLSHETYVNDETYKNLPGYIYHEIKYKNSDGTYTDCMFAEKRDGTKSILHEIITELLTARKKYKNQMEELKENGGDSFIVAILDGLQIAYKVTANSLYGQTGAPTSPIYMKQIAASTTATGREMLQFSKLFIEQIFSKMIQLALTNKDEYMKYMESQYIYHPTKFIFDDGSEVHIETVDKKSIPETKFSKKSIELYIKSYEDMIKKYPEDLKHFNITTVDSYENLIKSMQSLPYEEQTVIHSNLVKLFEGDVSCKLNNTIISNKKDLKKLIENNWSNTFPGDFMEIFYNIGYKNRKEMFLKFYDTVNILLNGEQPYTVEPKGIYGDTDSIFYCMHLKDKKTKEIIKDKRALITSIKFGVWSSILISTMLPAPMVQEYEKVLWPFVILTKKRYVGNLYEKSPDKFYQKSMGIVLKRRDNANVVKIVVGNIVDQILNKQSTTGAVKITQELLSKIVRGKISLDKFIITKTLKTTYKDRTRIVHAVLADRMGLRDPGNKPHSNDRIPYAYIEVPDETQIKLQGDRVEHWDYILEHKLKLDYLFYITNQIMKPSLQFLELIVEQPEKIFKEYIIREENRKQGKMPIGYYLQETDNIKNIDFDDFAEIVDKDYNKDEKFDSNKTEKTKKVVKKVVKKVIKKVVKKVVKKDESNSKESNSKESKSNNSKDLDLMMDDFN
jgi:DNA polymerase elongation subunit (family B)